MYRAGAINKQNVVGGAAGYRRRVHQVEDLSSTGVVHFVVLTIGCYMNKHSRLSNSSLPNTALKWRAWQAVRKICAPPLSDMKRGRLSRLKLLGQKSARLERAPRTLLTASLIEVLHLLICCLLANDLRIKPITSMSSKNSAPSIIIP